jgi:putative resolvase
VRRWEREGKLTAKRLTVVYSHVSRAGQREDLAAQEQYCRAGAIAVDVWIQQVGGGTNFRRKRFLTLIERIQRGEIERVLIAHKDRLVRFGFDLLDDLSREHGCEIVVVNQESLSPQQEMAEDLLAIVHTFSCRLYGLRKYRKQIREDFPGSREPKEILQ